MKKICSLIIFAFFCSPAFSSEASNLDLFGIRAKTDYKPYLKIRSKNTVNGATQYDLDFESFKMDDSFISSAIIRDGKVFVSIRNNSSTPIPLSLFGGVFKITLKNGVTFVLEQTFDMTDIKNATSDSYLNPMEQVDFVLALPEPIISISKNDVDSIFIEFPNLCPIDDGYTGIHLTYFYLVPTP